MISNVLDKTTSLVEALKDNNNEIISSKNEFTFEKKHKFDLLALKLE